MARAAIERSAHFVQVPDVVGIDGCHAEALAAGLNDKSLSMQKSESMADGLARYAKPVGEFALTGFENQVAASGR